MMRLSCWLLAPLALGQAQPPALLSVPGLVGPHTPDRSAAANLFERLPMRFEANRGQVDPRVEYYSKGDEYMLFLTRREAVLSLASERGTGVVRISLPGSNPRPVIEGIDPLASRANYFLGQRRENWHAGVPTYRRVRYRSVYPGIDLIYYGSGKQLEYDFVVTPCADPRRIRLRFSGSDAVRIDEAGNLIVRVGGEDLRQPKPVVYQESAGARAPVGGRYELLGRTEVGFTIGPYDRSRKLVIDPVLVYSSFLGAANRDLASAVAVDSKGYIWVAGNTNSRSFPTAGEPVFDINKGNQDIFVARFNPSASGAESLVYCTYLGGANDDEVRGVTVDAFGKLYLVGNTASTDFPLQGAVHRDTNAGDRDAFLAIIDPSQGGLSSLAYSTYLGGEAADFAQAVALDATGKVYVVGYTLSLQFSIAGDVPQISNRTGWDAFLARFDLSIEGAGSLTYSTYLGGASTDVATGVAVDAQGRMYVGGYTFSNDFPVTDRVHRDIYAGGGDVFLTRIDPAKPGLDALDYSTYLGGSGLDVAYSMVLDARGGVVFSGYTLSNDFPLAGDSLQRDNAGNADIFIARLDPSLPPSQALTYSTYFGGSSADVAYGMVLDAAGRVYLAGYSMSTDLPTRGTDVQTTMAGTWDAFVAVIDPSLNADQSLVYCSYFGGTGADVAYGIAVDSRGDVYIAGLTQTLSFPITGNAYQGANGGFVDAFVTKLRVAP